MPNDTVTCLHKFLQRSEIMFVHIYVHVSVGSSCSFNEATNGVGAIVQLWMLHLATSRVAFCVSQFAANGEAPKFGGKKWALEFLSSDQSASYTINKYQLSLRCCEQQVGIIDSPLCWFSCHKIIIRELRLWLSSFDCSEDFTVETSTHRASYYPCWLLASQKRNKYDIYSAVATSHKKYTMHTTFSLLLNIYFLLKE